MNFISGILQQMLVISKSRVKFMTVIFSTILAVPGKINFRNMSRFCSYSEKTISRNFRNNFDYIKFNLLSLKQILDKTKVLLIAVDCSFISKSGKITYGLAKFYNGVASRAEKGLEIFLMSLVDPKMNTGYYLTAKQTPGDKDIKNNLRNKEATRVDFYLQCLIDVAKYLPIKVKYCVADGYFSKKKFVDGVLKLKLHLISKLRKDADLRFLYTGPQKKRGRPKKYDGKVYFNNISRFDYIDKIDDGIFLYTTQVYCINLKRALRIALLVKEQKNGDYCYVVLCSTDINQNATEIYEYYKSRFQIEFIFRDAKQYTGLCDCQSTKKESLDFHFNASLTTLNLAKIDAVMKHDESKPFVFSMLTYKRLAFNELFCEKIFSMLGFDLSLIKMHPDFKDTMRLGAIAS